MEWAAYVFTAAVFVAVVFQLALAMGAPWGELAMGGRYPGRFPPPMRVAAVVQAAVLGGLAWVVLAHANVVDASVPAGSIWVVVGLSGLSLLMNAASRSRRERMLWTPVAAVMLVTSLFVALG